MREELADGDINRAWNLFTEIQIVLNFNFSLTCPCEFDMINVCNVLAAIYAYAQLCRQYESHGSVYEVREFVVLSGR